MIYYVTVFHVFGVGTLFFGVCVCVCIKDCVYSISLHLVS